MVMGINSIGRLDPTQFSVGQVFYHCWPGYHDKYEVITLPYKKTNNLWVVEAKRLDTEMNKTRVFLWYTSSHRVGSNPYFFDYPITVNPDSNSQNIIY